MKKLVLKLGFKWVNLYRYSPCASTGDFDYYLDVPLALAAKGAIFKDRPTVGLLPA